ncbi:MAG: hypothetical protein V1737_06470 [Chloroflexota bacterium]
MAKGKATILNYTTEVAAEKTISQIERLLANHGASAIIKEYGDTKQVKAIEFDVKTKFGLRTIRLPAKVEAVYRILAGDGWWPEPKKSHFQAQAQRVAWRIILRWVEAQLALIQTEQSSLDEIFLPYMLTSGGQTMYQALVNNQLQLPSKGTGGDQL